MMPDDNILVKELGISKQLMEHSQIESPFWINDKNLDNIKVYIHPPIKDTGLVYFKLYGEINPGEHYIWTAKKCARISMLNPEYIRCTDCSMDDWILSYNEREYLCNLLTDDIWNSLLYTYYNEVEYMYKNPERILYLQMPDYSKLPVK